MSNALFAQTEFAGKIFTYSSSNKLTTVEPYILCYEDKTSELPFHTVLKEEKDLFKTPYSEDLFPEGSSVFWMKIRIANLDSELSEVAVGTSKFDSIEFYLPDFEKGSYRMQKGGMRVHTQEKLWSMGANSYAFFPLEGKDTVDLYIRGKYIDRPYYFAQYQPMSISIGAFKKVSHDKSSRDNAFRYILGAFLIMFIYNVFLYIITRDKGYIAYSLFTIFVVFFNWAFSGAIAESLPFSGWFDQVNEFIGCMLMLFYIVFVKTLFPLKERFPKHNRILNIFIVYFIILQIPVYLGFSKYLSAISAIPFIGSLGVAVHVSYILVFKEKYLPAKYFFWGNLFNFLFTNIAILQTITFFQQYYFGIDPYIYTATGSLIELSLFSLSLGSRLKVVEAEVAEERLRQERLQTEEEQKRNDLIRRQNEELEGKVKERTQELELKNAEIHERNEELIQISEELQAKNEVISQTAQELELQKGIIEHAHQNITSSINYAFRIQNSILPNKANFKMLFPESFIFFQPKDVVSGDFYWFHSIEKDGKLYYIVVVADCTGHGVPGAMMSMICMNQLTRLVQDFGYVMPDQILAQLDESLVHLLKQKDSQNRDGMDGAILVYTPEDNKIYFSGAKRPLYYYANDTEFCIKGSSISVGGDLRVHTKTFELHELSLDANTMFYLFSDGYADQFGEETKRKFMVAKLRKQMYEASTLPIDAQESLFSSRFNEWKGANIQTDDVLFIGIKMTTTDNSSLL